MIRRSIHEYSRLMREENLRGIIDIIVMELMDAYNLREFNIQDLSIEREDEKVEVNIKGKVLKDGEENERDIQLNIQIKFKDYATVYKFTADGDLGIISISIISKFYKYPDFSNFLLTKYYDFFKGTRELRLINRDAFNELCG